MVHRSSNLSEKYFVEPNNINDTNTNVISAKQAEAMFGLRLVFSYISNGLKSARKTNTNTDIPTVTYHLDWLECCIGLGLFSILNMT